MSLSSQHNHKTSFLRRRLIRHLNTFFGALYNFYSKSSVLMQTEIVPYFYFHFFEVRVILIRMSCFLLPLQFSDNLTKFAPAIFWHFVTQHTIKRCGALSCCKTYTVVQDNAKTKSANSSASRSFHRLLWRVTLYPSAIFLWIYPMVCSFQNLLSELILHLVVYFRY